MAQSNVSGGGGASTELVAPHGIDQIMATFGDIYEYMRADGNLDPRWQAEFLTKAQLPFPLALSWDAAISVRQITCHKKMAELFEQIFQDLKSHGLQSGVSAFGGCFSFRPQRAASKLSTHAWGIAIDLNPAANAQGTAGDMDPEVVSMFVCAGFSWGGEWLGKRRDPMHFQFCTGY